jgi:hypothetical protein
MLLEWIKREPVAFSQFASAVTAVVLIFATDFGLKPEAASGIAGMVALGLAWITRAIVVPNSKLSDAAIDRAAGMNKADIAEVAAVKAEAKASP